MGKELVSAAVLALVLAGCGSTSGERALTAGGTGAAAGALAGGPVGAIIGGSLGAIGGAIAPTDGITMTKNAINMVTPHSIMQDLTKPAPETVTPQTVATAPVAPVALPVHLSRDEIKQAQQALQQAGFYKGRIDGIVGRQTEAAVLQYQHQQGLAETGRLDGPTVDKMNLHPQNQPNPPPPAPQQQQ
jgi:hypothetical protein